MISATERHRFPLCRHSPLDASGFFLHCLSYVVKEGTDLPAKGRGLPGPDPLLLMVTIHLTLPDRHNYRNSSNFMNTSSTTIS